MSIDRVATTSIAAFHRRWYVDQAGCIGCEFDGTVTDLIALQTEGTNRRIDEESGFVATGTPGDRVAFKKQVMRRCGDLYLPVAFGGSVSGYRAPAHVTGMNLYRVW